MSSKVPKEDVPKIGAKLRQLRRTRSITQAELAEALAISPSYLNMIEHNRRTITVPLLLKLAQKFGLEINDLMDSDEARLAGDLLEIFSDPVFGDVNLTNVEVRELAASNPNIARAFLHLYDHYNTGQGTGSFLTDKDGQTEKVASEQISDFLQSKANYFPTLEHVADRIKSDLSPVSFECYEALTIYGSNVFGLQVKIGVLPANLRYKSNEDVDILIISETLSRESRIFLLAKEIARRAAHAEIEYLVNEASFAHEAVNELARSTLASYVAGALLMPYEDFLNSAKMMRYDVLRLAQKFDVSFEQACHRLTTLQKPGQTGVPFHLVRTDIAGNISKRFSLSGIQIPRYGGACPRWNVYTAFLQPGRVITQISEMPDGKRYFCIAHTFTKGESRYNAPVRHMSIGLGCDLSYASQMIYAEGLNLKNPPHVIEIGINCRICPRKECSERAFPALPSVVESGKI